MHRTKVRTSKRLWIIAIYDAKFLFAFISWSKYVSFPVDVLVSIAAVHVDVHYISPIVQRRCSK